MDLHPRNGIKSEATVEFTKVDEKMCYLATCSYEDPSKAEYYREPRGYRL